MGGGEHDVVLFCGSGSTAAIATLIHVLDLARSERPVVFVGPYEHHSNELPWRESVADVVTVLEGLGGGPDLDHLEHELRRHADRPLKIGSFSAASNVAGILTDVDAVSAVLRRHGALSCWDYATAGPYLPIAMAGKDAVFLSPHKFLGGPGTPGVLVVKRALLRNRVPSVPGGGTVLFVTPRGHTYHPAPEVREEGGTPAIVESIRAGLVFALKERIGVDVIRRRECDLARHVLSAWGANPRIEIIGDPAAPRLPIVSFGLRHAPRLLHANFVVALLSDLFGIQARSGCFCAGPYLHRAYAVSDEWSARMEAECERGQFGAKLGFVRITFNYAMSDTVVDYVLDAVQLLAEHAWKLLPLYRFDPASGLWHHRERPPAARPTLDDALREPAAALPTAGEDVLADQLAAARAIIHAAQAHPPRPCDNPSLSEEFEAIRWFPLPADVLGRLETRRAS